MSQKKIGSMHRADALSRQADPKISPNPKFPPKILKV